jgi:hypothetical protein
VTEAVLHLGGEDEASGNRNVVLILRLVLDRHAHLYRGELITIDGTRLGHFVTIEGLAEAIHLWLKQQLDVAS